MGDRLSLWWGSAFSGTPVRDFPYCIPGMKSRTRTQCTSFVRYIPHAGPIWFHVRFLESVQHIELCSYWRIVQFECAPPRFLRRSMTDMQISSPGSFQPGPSHHFLESSYTASIRTWVIPSYEHACAEQIPWCFQHTQKMGCRGTLSCKSRCSRSWLLFLEFDLFYSYKILFSKSRIWSLPTLYVFGFSPKEKMLF